MSDNYYDDQHQIYSGSPQQYSGSPKQAYASPGQYSSSPRTSPGRTSAGRAHHTNSQTVFNLDLTVMYNTRIGQEVHAIGSIPELGSWKTNGHKL